MWALWVLGYVLVGAVLFVNTARYFAWDNAHSNGRIELSDWDKDDALYPASIIGAAWPLAIPCIVIVWTIYGLFVGGQHLMRHFSLNFWSQPTFMKYIKR